MSQATREARAAEIAAKQSGEGRIVFVNSTQGDLLLPKPSLDVPAKRSVSPGEMFIGDSYHRVHMDRLVKIVQVLESTVKPTPAEPQDATTVETQKTATGELPSQPADTSGVDQKNDVID